MSDGEAVDIACLFNSDIEVTVEDCYFGRACNKLDEGVHEFLVEPLHDVPQPPYDW